MVNSVLGVQQNYFDYILFRFFSIINWASPVAQMVVNPPAIQETWVQSLDWEDPLEKGMATHSLLPGEFHGQRSLANYSLLRANSLAKRTAEVEMVR